jgi:hypothetical protein
VKDIDCRKAINFGGGSGLSYRRSFFIYGTLEPLAKSYLPKAERRIVPEMLPDQFSQLVLMTGVFFLR